MTYPFARRIALCLLAGGIACSGTGQGTMSSAPRPPVAAEPASRTQPSESAIDRARADSLRRPYTAADIHFMSAMIGHHAQALAMARLAENRAASPSVQNL